MLKPTSGVHPIGASDPGDRDLPALFASEESHLLRFAWSLTGRRAVAEEIVQEVFLQLHAKWDEVETPAAWLYRSVRNRALHFLRKSKREVLRGEEESPAIMNWIDETPDRLLEHMETVAEIRQLVKALPDKDRRLIQLRYFEGLKYREISTRTGLSISNVGFRLHQALKQLAKGLHPLGDDEPS